jgi:hypothetical protein
MESGVGCVAQEVVPRGMEANLVDAIAKTIVRLQLGWMLVSVEAKREDFRTPG